MLHVVCRRLFYVVGTRSYYTIKNVAKPESDVARQLQTRIKMSGPITVADFMKEALTNPVSGYYTRNDMFGEEGDFVTSPELGQLFGEMVAVWFLNEWAKAGSPKPFQIVELGPGRGSLCQDILRVFEHFKMLNEATVRLVEVSPVLSNVQAQKLCINSNNISDELIYRQGVSHYGVPITWHRHLKDLPDAFTLLVAHEFFDALPIHKFQNTDEGYREILIDIDTTKELGFRYVLAREHTPASKILIKQDETREHFEISPQSIIITKEIAARLENHGGLALIADYGHDGAGTDTFRAYKKHKQENPLVDVGNADLTADVDFLTLKNVNFLSFHKQTKSNRTTFAGCYRNGRRNRIWTDRPKRFLATNGHRIPRKQIKRKHYGRTKKNIRIRLQDDDRRGQNGNEI